MSNQPTFLRSVTTLFSGTVIAQAVPFLAAPVIARLYGPEQFAVFGTLMAVFNILNVVAAGRYEMAVVVPAHDEESAHLVRGALFIAIAMGVFSFIAVWLFGLSTRIAEKLPGLGQVAWIAATLAALAGAQVVLQQWLLRRKRFGAVARAKVVQAAGITMATLVLGKWNVGNGLEVGYLMGWFAFTAVTVWFVVRREPLPAMRDRSRSVEALRSYREWPMVNTWPALVNALASGMATFYMASYFDPDTAGQHNFVRQYVLVPISMITVALAQVLFVRTSERVREGQPLGPELMRVLRMLVLAALALIAVLVFFGEPLFRWVFGPQWGFAGTAGRVLVWGYAAQLVGSPFGVVLLSLRKVRTTVLFPLLFLALLLVLPTFKTLPPLSFMAALAAVEVAAYTAHVVIVFRVVGRYDRTLVPV